MKLRSPRKNWIFLAFSVLFSMLLLSTKFVSAPRLEASSLHPSSYLFKSAVVWPNRPVRIVHSLPIGYAGELASRQIASEMSRITGQAFTISNRVDPQSLLSMEDVAKAQPDGYTLLACDPSNLELPIATHKIDRWTSARAIFSQQLKPVVRGVFADALVVPFEAPIQLNMSTLPISGLCVSKDVPIEIVDAIRNLFNQALNTDASARLFQRMGAIAQPMDNDRLLM
jgi:Tripartite tricarboxylate transporter family receptor